MVNLYNKNLNQYARDNRQTGNLSEVLLWNQLKKKQLSFDFTKQKPIGNYIADFYCKELNFVIEIDGDSHDAKIDYDYARDEYMKSLGIKVLRILDIDVKRNMNGVINLIKKNIEDIKPSPSPAATPLRRRGILCLGIESSCDETSAALVDSDRNILSHVIYSSIPEHQKYGGVVPELAARAHILAIDEVINKTLLDAGKTMADVDVIAATAGPGLIGGVLIGWMTAVGIAQSTGKPLVAVNHLEGHALVPRLTNNVPFPYLLVLASGGHTQILRVCGVGKYELIGQTLDDSAGEAFDKVSKMLGLGYPGGPVVDMRGARGDATRFKFPRPLCDKPGCDFSFSGIKTSVRTEINKNPEFRVQSSDKDTEIRNLKTENYINDVCASFQQSVVDCIINRLENALKTVDAKTLVVAGGVAKNSAIRSAMERLATEHDMTFAAPPLNLCTDNGAMIAWAGIENFNAGKVVTEPIAPRPRWSLTEL